MDCKKYTSSTLHSGALRCYTSFCASGETFATDVPSALGGRGEYPTPAAMLGACLASCTLSMIAYTAARHDIPAEGIIVRAACSERAGSIQGFELDISVPRPIPEDERKKLEAAARSCPVGRALHPEIEKRITWHWAD